MRNKETKELVAMKYIERGYKVPSTYNPLQGGKCFDPHTFGYCNGVPAGGELFERIHAGWRGSVKMRLDISFSN
ncbi:hypothetical protein K1719_018582 [Acacia pycnantha]|nr:hypothetical protein K1719_018582 [Acacia pycnantha]